MLRCFFNTDYINDNTAVIDWESSNLASLGSINALVNVKAPDLSVCTVEPGTNYMDNLVRHSGMNDPVSGVGAVSAVVSQMSIWRNYAPRVSLQDISVLENSLNFSIELEDKSTSWWDDDPLHQFFSYGIDWDGDGIIDEDGTATFDEEAVPHSKYPSLFTWSSGIQTSTLSLNHVYDAPGNYIATINVSDLRLKFSETTSLQIPVNVASVSKLPQKQ